MKITPSEIINEFQVVYSSSDSARSKPNRYRSVLELLLKYLLDIPRDEYHSTAHLVSLSRTYHRAFRLDLPRRTRRLNEYFNFWSHANSSKFEIEEFRAIEDEFKLLLEDVLEISIATDIPPQNLDSYKTGRSSKPSSNMTKSEALDFINQQIGSNTLLHSNSSISNINRGSGTFWLNINQDKFDNDLNIVLVDRKHIIWILIPSRLIIYPDQTFYTRRDNGKVDLDIPTKDSSNFLIDSKSGFNFMPFAKIFSRS